jgi:curved DNA-binding protein CbpA
MSEPYRVLLLAPGARTEEVERAYRKLVRRYPPELNPQRFAEIHRAYKRLTSLEQAMEEAFDQPTEALDRLFPTPIVRLRPADNPPPNRAAPPDLEPLVQGLRHQLLRLVLRGSVPG